MATVGVNIVKTLGEIALGNSGAIQFAASLDRTSIAGTPIGLQSLPNPFVKILPTKERQNGTPGINYNAQGSDAVLVSEIELGGLKLPLPIIQVKCRNNIRTKPNAGGDAEVNEIVGSANWDVKITGWVINTFNGIQVRDYPFDVLEQQIAMFRNKLVSVSSEYLRRFDIHKVAIKEIDFANEGGYENAFGYTIVAVSDSDIELELS